MASVAAVHACVKACMFVLLKRQEYPCVEVFVKGLLLGMVSG